MKLYQIINPNLIPESRDIRRPTNLDTMASQQYNIAKNRGTAKTYPKIAFYDYKRTGETKAGFVNPTTNKWILTPGNITAIIPAKTITNPPTYYIQTYYHGTNYYYQIKTNPALIKNLKAAKQNIKYYYYDPKTKKYTIQQSPITIQNQQTKKRNIQQKQLLNQQWTRLLQSPEGADYYNSIEQANQLLYTKVHTAFKSYQKTKKFPINTSTYIDELVIITTQIEELHQTDDPDPNTLKQLKEQYEEAVDNLIYYYYGRVLELYQIIERRDYMLEEIIGNTNPKIKEAIKQALNNLITPDLDYIDPLDHFQDEYIINTIKKYHLE